MGCGRLGCDHNSHSVLHCFRIWRRHTEHLPRKIPCLSFPMFSAVIVTNKASLVLTDIQGRGVVEYYHSIMKFQLDNKYLGKFRI